MDGFTISEYATDFMCDVLVGKTEAFWAIDGSTIHRWYCDAKARKADFAAECPEYAEQKETA
jgi:hypothetical protein